MSFLNGAKDEGHAVKFLSGAAKSLRLDRRAPACGDLARHAGDSSPVKLATERLHRAAAVWRTSIAARCPVMQREGGGLAKPALRNGDAELEFLCSHMIPPTMFHSG